MTYSVCQLGKQSKEKPCFLPRRDASWCCAVTRGKRYPSGSKAAAASAAFTASRNSFASVGWTLRSKRAFLQNEPIFRAIPGRIIMDGSYCEPRICATRDVGNPFRAHLAAARWKSVLGVSLVAKPLHGASEGLPRRGLEQAALYGLGLIRGSDSGSIGSSSRFENTA